MKPYDLLSTVEYGGCSAKLSANDLSTALADLPKTPHKNLLVDIETHDDAGVYKVSDDLALIQTTDFFPPVCSDPYEFGQIAAANALSDVYAMGGEVLTALNIVAFPTKVPLDVLKEILRGGIEKVIEAGGVMMGGHTIVDDVPKYGLAVTGSIHPDRIITNAAAKPGDVLILTKPIGAGIIMAGKRIGEIEMDKYQPILESMKQLNKEGGRIMQKYKVKCATDITGFGLLGHALKLAMGSNVTLKIDSKRVPSFNGALDLIELGCIPGACFRNLEYVENECTFEKSLRSNHKMLLLDAQTSGGLLICCNENDVNNMIAELSESGYACTSVIGSVCEKGNKYLLIN
ncbi:MAG: selenide, water dikinase SelD [Bacteroidetes bacterium GWF2_33_16]|nr:MAG: selenide, water dikinase SelD [Bacteroidetes bacterium GWE2_32_14]OFY06575.1 MAG: selenide, water dikinase SelD [Bacteroidetes bacterium GWF2_33_16]